jgi:hypothetical protein
MSGVPLAEVLTLGQPWLKARLESLNVPAAPMFLRRKVSGGGEGRAEVERQEGHGVNHTAITPPGTTRTRCAGCRAPRR